ncbi:hypothetical protein EV360DRAFT_76405 [Lentinula raphanica]|nr:hypothetical protein EV360DRAFT_76405 [Lentinula raphanica]
MSLPLITTESTATTSTALGLQVSTNSVFTASLPSSTVEVSNTPAPGPGIIPSSIRAEFLQFMVDRHLLDPTILAGGYLDGFIDGLMNCFVGHVMGVRQLAGAHDLERTILLQQVEEAQADLIAAKNVSLRPPLLIKINTSRIYKIFEWNIETWRNDSMMFNCNCRRSLLSFHETVEYLQTKDDPVGVAHELSQTKEELKWVRRDLEISRNSVQTLQETVSLHLDTISVKDDQINVLNTLVATLENRVSTVQASSMVALQQHTDMLLAHNTTSANLDSAVSFIRKLSHALLLQHSLDLEPFLIAIRRDLATLSQHCRDADWTQTVGMYHYMIQSLQTIKDITSSAAYARAHQTELIDLDGMVESAKHIIAEAHGGVSIPAMDLSVHRLDPELPGALRNTSDSNWVAPDLVSLPHASSDTSTSIFGDDYTMTTPETVSHCSSPAYQPFSPEVDVGDYGGDEDFYGDLAYPHLDD